MSNITSYRLSMTKSNAFIPLGMTEIGRVDEAGYRQVGGSGICKRMHIILPNLINWVVVVSCHKFAGPPIPGIIVIARKCIHQEGHHWRINTECNVGIHILHTPQLYLKEVGHCILPRVLYTILLHLTWYVFLFVNDATHSHLWNFKVCLRLMFMHVHNNN